MPEITPHNVIHGLPLVSFRGVEAPPYDDATFGFSHAQAERAYPYIDGAAHEGTGLNPEKIRFTFYFINGPGLGLENFPSLWERWWKELQDGSPGELVHPILGPRQVVVEGGDVRLTSRTVSGVIANINFSTTILDPEDEQQFEGITVNMAEVAAKLDQKAEFHLLPLPSQAGVTSFLDIIKMLDTFLFQLNNDLDAAITLVQSKTDELIRFIDKTRPDHAVTEVRDLCTALWSAADDMKDNIAKRMRPTGAALIDQPTTLTAFADERGMTLAEAMSLNPAALAGPTVSKGTLLRFFT